MLAGWHEGHPACKNMGRWWRWALVSPDGVAPSRMVGVTASVNLHLHHKVQKFSSGTGSPGWSRKKGRKTVVCVCVCACGQFFTLSRSRVRLSPLKISLTKTARMNNNTAADQFSNTPRKRQLATSCGETAKRCHSPDNCQSAMHGNGANVILILIWMTMFMVLSSWQGHCESSPGSFIECRLSAGRLPTLKPS